MKQVRNTWTPTHETQQESPLDAIAATLVFGVAAFFILLAGSLF